MQFLLLELDFPPQRDFGDPSRNFLPCRGRQLANWVQVYGLTPPPFPSSDMSHHFKFAGWRTWWVALHKLDFDLNRGSAGKMWRMQPYCIACDLFEHHYLKTIRLELAWIWLYNIIRNYHLTVPINLVLCSHDAHFLKLWTVVRGIGAQ